jgi:hypothetical protein
VSASAPNGVLQGPIQAIRAPQGALSRRVSSLGCARRLVGENALKLPVLKAVAATFAFVLQNWRTLLQIVWLPFLLMTALSIFTTLIYNSRVTEFLATGRNSPADVQAFMTETGLLTFALAVPSSLLGLMLTSGILRFVIRGDRPSAPFYLRWGRDEWSLLGTCAILFGAGLLVAFAAAIAIAVVGVLLMAVPLLASFVPLLLFCGAIWLLMRVYFAFPASIAHRRLGVGIAWEASAGQVWRLLALLLILGAIVTVYQTILLIVLMPDILAIYSELFAGRIDVAQANLRMAAAAPSVLDIRNLALWLLSMIPTVVGTVALGVAWRLIDDDTVPEPVPEPVAASA